MLYVISSLNFGQASEIVPHEIFPTSWKHVVNVRDTAVAMQPRYHSIVTGPFVVVKIKPVKICWLKTFACSAPPPPLVPVENNNSLYYYLLVLPLYTW